MARSTYIYVVQGEAQGDIWAAFTVKHELESYINSIEGDDCDDYIITRVKDGKEESSEPYFIDVPIVKQI